MSRIEPNTFINDRYQAIEDRLQVSGQLQHRATAAFSHRPSSGHSSASCSAAARRWCASA